MKLASAALVAVTVQVPTPVPVKVVPVTEQKVPPAVTAKVTALVPEPPLVDSVLVPLNAIDDGDENAVTVACVARTTVMSKVAVAAL